MQVRRARREDVPALVALYADDIYGAARETPHDLAPYYEAFAALDAEPHQQLVVAEEDGRVVGTLQLTFIRQLSARGGTVAQIEAVRIAGDLRGAAAAPRCSRGPSTARAPPAAAACN